MKFGSYLNHQVDSGLPPLAGGGLKKGFQFSEGVCPDGGFGTGQNLLRPPIFLHQFHVAVTAVIHIHLAHFGHDPHRTGEELTHSLANPGVQFKKRNRFCTHIVRETGSCGAKVGKNG